MTDIALLVPVYDDPTGLQRTLASLPGEVPLHVLVVDDGSEPPIRLPGVPAPHTASLLRIDANRGIEHALNAGLEHLFAADYRYIARVDAGDVALPGRFASQAAFLDANPDHAMVGGQVRFVDGDGNEVYRAALPVDYRMIRRYLHARNCFIHPAVMFRTSMLKRIGPYSDRYPAAEDYELFFRLACEWPVANLDSDVLLYHVNPQGISGTRRRRQVLSRLAVMRDYFDARAPIAYLSFVKNTALLFAPESLVLLLKRLLQRQRGWL